MTPIQKAIIEIAKSSDGGKTPAYAEAIVILRRLLPTEKEFIGKVWDAAISHHEQEERSPGLAGPRNPLPDKFKFLNQLYPEK